MFSVLFEEHPEDVIQTLRYAQRVIESTMPEGDERNAHIARLDRMVGIARTTEAVPAVAKTPVVLHSTNQQIDPRWTNVMRSIGIEDPKADHPVHHPNHYTAYKGLEVIDLTEQMNFNRGNAVKYISRAGLKSKDTEIQDLQKAAWYINREIERLENE